MAHKRENAKLEHEAQSASQFRGKKHIKAQQPKEQRTNLPLATHADQAEAGQCTDLDFCDVCWFHIIGALHEYEGFLLAVHVARIEAPSALVAVGQNPIDNVRNKCRYFWEEKMFSVEKEHFVLVSQNKWTVPTYILDHGLMKCE